MTALEHTSTLNTIIEQTSQCLVDALQLTVEDAARAGVVRPGKLQDDPTLKKINILVSPGGEEWPDVFNTSMGAPGIGGISLEMGGYGTYGFRRRIRIHLEMFFPNLQSRTDARTRAHVVMSRAQHALLMQHRHAFATLYPTDSFGEKAYAVAPLRSYLYEGGGPGDFNWRGELIIEYLTALEPRDL